MSNYADIALILFLKRGQKVLNFDRSETKSIYFGKFRVLNVINRSNSSFF